jgi:hypothetical protein
MRFLLEVILILLLLASFVSIFVGLIAPQLYKPLFRRDLGRGKTSLIFLGICIVTFVIIGVFGNWLTASSSVNPSENKAVVNNSPTPASTMTLTPTPSGNTTYHAPATDISGFPGLTKVLIKASMVVNANGMTFTNNENDQWDNCIDTINLDSGASNWYEYDFGSMAPGQSVTIQWNQLTKDDGTVYTPYNAGYKSDVILLSCELGPKTMGFAKFQY